jgi:hypothetical protein
VPTRRRRPALWIVSILAVAAAILVFVLVSDGLNWPRWPATETTYDTEPHFLELSFPDCSVVAVSWSNLNGTEVAFGVWTGPALFVSNCQGGPAPSNATCPPSSICSRLIYGPYPACFEEGTHGTCVFTATQPNYGLFAYTLNSTNVTNDSIRVTISDSAPTIPPGLEIPAFTCLVTVVFAAVAITAVEMERKRQK